MVVNSTVPQVASLRFFTRFRKVSTDDFIFCNYAFCLLKKEGGWETLARWYQKSGTALVVSEKGVSRVGHDT